MFVTYKNPGFDHSIDSICLFQKNDTMPHWSDALLYFYPQIDKEKLHVLAPEARKAYLETALKSVWNELADELNSKVVGVALTDRYEEEEEYVEEATAEGDASTKEEAPAEDTTEE